MTKTTFFLLGICAGAAVPLIARAAKPLGAYAIAGGMIAYEAACDAGENSRDFLSASTKRIRRALKNMGESS